MNTLQEQMNAAAALAAAGHYPAAYQTYRELCAAHDDVAALHSNLAGMALLLGNTDESETHYRQALAIDPALSEAALGLARALIQGGAYSTAMQHLAQMGELDAAEQIYLTGICHEKLADDAAARAAYSQAAALNYRPAQKALVSLLRREGESAAAMREGFRVSGAARIRWQFAERCWASSPQDPLLYEAAAACFLADHQFAYAARVRAAAQRALPELDLGDWPALQESEW